MSDYVPLPSTTWSDNLEPTFRTQLKQNLIHLMVSCGKGPFDPMYKVYEEYATLVESQVFATATSKEDYNEKMNKKISELQEYYDFAAPPQMIIQLEPMQQNVTVEKASYKPVKINKVCKKTKKSKVIRAFWYYLSAMILVVLFLICVELGYILAIKMFGDC